MTGMRSRGRARCVVGIAAIAALTTALLLPSVARAATTAANSMDTWRLQRVELPVTHAAFVKSRNVVLATVNYNHAVFGNDLVELAPDTGAVARHVYVGSQPNTFAVSDDDTVAYVGFEAATEIVKVNLLTFTVEDRFSTRLNPDFGAAPVVESLAVPPGHPQTVIASLQIPGISPRFDGVYAYRDGVRLPSSVSATTNELLYAAGVLYAAGNETSNAGFVSIALVDDGLHVMKDSTGSVGIARHMKPAGGGRIATTGGHLVDPSVPTVVRDFHQYGAFAPTPANDRITYVGDPDGGAVGYTVSQFRISTGAKVASRSFGYALSEAQDIIGTKAGFVVTMPQFIIGGGTSFYLLGPAVSAASTPGPRPPVYLDALSPSRLPISAAQLAYDPTRLLLYATVTSASMTAPDSLVAIDPLTGEIRHQLGVGSKPAALAVADDRSTAYVSVTGTSEVVAVDLATFTVKYRVALEQINPPTDLHAQERPVAGDIAVRPGTNNTIAVSLATVPNERGVAIYTDGVRTAASATYPIAPQAVNFADASTLYAPGYDGELYRYTLDADGLQLVATTQRTGLGLGFKITADGRAWGTNGIVDDLADGSMVAQFAALSYGGVVPLPALDRVFKADENGISEYTASTYRLLGSLREPLGYYGPDLVRTTTGFAAGAPDAIVLFNPSPCHGFTPTLAGAGVIIGTPGKDVIVGSLGNDLIDGGGGNDVICALAGNDRVFGGAGDDDLDGGLGTDAVFLGTDAVRHVVDLDDVADDGTVWGDGRPNEADNVRSSNEIIVGSPGPDRIVGTTGRQMLRGLAGDDELFGGAGDDILDGGDGNDVCGRALGGDIVNLCEVLR